MVIDYTNVRHVFISGQRETSKILHAIDEQQLYRFRVAHNQVAQYNCYVANCKAKLYLESEVCYRKAKYEPHNHGANDMIEEIILKNSIKKRCRSVAVEPRRSGAGAGNVRSVYLSSIREWVFFFLHTHSHTFSNYFLQI